jgi:hypothetical protein
MLLATLAVSVTLGDQEADRQKFNRDCDAEISADPRCDDPTRHGGACNPDE